MKRALATILAVGVAVVAPAAAGAQVQLTFKTWKVTTKNGLKHSVAPKGSFVRCGRKVVKITATYDYSGATKGSSFKEIWSLDGTDFSTLNPQWEHTTGTAQVSVVKNGNPLDDGKYKLRVRQHGTGLGSSYITIKPGTGC
jgi:hypothetical protein